MQEDLNEWADFSLTEMSSPYTFEDVSKLLNPEDESEDEWWEG